MVYDISFNALNVTDEATDLGVSITGNASSVGIGDTVHLVISLSNLGPKSCDAKLNYKIPVGLKLLSSQGPGVYDSVSGVWNAGLLLVNDTVCLDLVLQATNIGYFVNMVSVYGDLTSTHAVPAKPIVKVFNGKWRSTAAMSDSNGGNNKASFSFDVRNSFNIGNGENFDYKWPDEVPPVPEPKPELQPPTPNPPEPPKPNPQPNSRLGQDILNVRESVSTGTKVDSDESSSDDNQDDSKIIWDIFKEVFGSPDFDILAAMALITYMLAFLLSAVPGLVLGWTLTGILAASILVYSAILFIITILILIGALYLFYSRPKS